MAKIEIDKDLDKQELMVTLNGWISSCSVLEEEQATQYRSKSTVLYLDLRVWRIAEILTRYLHFYTALNLDSKTEIFFSIHYTGLSQRTLTVSNQLHASLFDREYRSKQDQVSWEKTITLKDLSVHFEELVYQCAQTLFSVFDYHLGKDRVHSLISS